MNNEFYLIKVLERERERELEIQTKQDLEIIKALAGPQEEATDTANNFIRNKMREDSFMRRIIPPILIQDNQI